MMELVIKIINHIILKQSDNDNEITATTTDEMNELLVTGDNMGNVNIYQIENGYQIKLENGHNNTITSLQFISNNKIIIVFDWIGIISIWYHKWNKYYIRNCI